MSLPGRRTHMEDMLSVVSEGAEGTGPAASFFFSIPPAALQHTEAARLGAVRSHRGKHSGAREATPSCASEANGVHSLSVAQSTALANKTTREKFRNGPSCFTCYPRQPLPDVRRALGAVAAPRTCCACVCGGGKKIDAGRAFRARCAGRAHSAPGCSRARQPPL